ncbi:hypothetical protein SK128_015819 [Halocaridina rubra]|uniref:Uncharacterized protein n=1 Tax=Halocaridina rubra TaxID=373956 RepID=A0AAN8X865_HALRR
MMMKIFTTEKPAPRWEELSQYALYKGDICSMLQLSGLTAEDLCPPTLWLIQTGWGGLVVAILYPQGAEKSDLGVTQLVVNVGSLARPLSYKEE